MKKLLTIGLVVSVLAMTLGAVVAVPVRAASAGDLIKMSGNPAVYYLGSDSKRYVFPNQHCYMTWYQDFSGVVTVSQSELESYSIGGNVTYRPGSRLVKITTDPKTYAVEPGGVLRWVSSETIASALYGAEWWSKIDDVPDPFWVNYTTGSDITTETYPTGALVMESGGSTVYYIDGSEKRPVADEAAFNSNRFNWNYLLTATSLASYIDGSSITAAEGDLTTVAGPEVTPSTSSTGTLTVNLASDTPASQTLVQNAIWVKITKINFTASGGDVIVDSVTLKRTGLAQDANFSEVYLIDAGTDTLFDNEKTLGSQHTAVVQKDFNVANGTTKSFYIAATMGATLYPGETPKLGVSAVAVKGDATVSGTFPIEGNGMAMNNSISIGDVNVHFGSTNPSAASKPVGTNDYVFAASKLIVDAVEDVQVEKLRFYQAGTASDADVGNLDLVVDGVVLATIANPSSRYVTYDLASSPFTISKGQNKTFEVRGDILDGSSRTIYFNFDKKTDVVVKGKTYGYYISPDYYATGNTTVDTSSPYWDNSSSGDDAVTTVSTGTMGLSKAALASTNAAEGATQQELGAFYFNVQGEEISVTSLPIHVDVTGSGAANATDVTNLTIYDSDGVIVAGPMDSTAAYIDEADDGVATFTDTIIFPAGINAYIIKGDLSSDFAADDTIKLQIDTPADITAKGQTTSNTVTPTPSSAIDGNTVTVKIADLNVSTSSSPAAQTVAAGTSNYIFANFVLDATQSGEDVKVTQLLIRHTTSEANIHNYITNLTLYDQSASTVALNTPQSGENSTTVSTATSTITLTNPLIIPKGTAKTLILKGNISGSSSANQEHEFSLVGTSCLTAYGNSTSNSVTEDITNSDGQTMTIIAAGTLQLANAGSNPVIGLVTSESTKTVGVFNFKPLYENIQVEKLGLTISGTSRSAIAASSANTNAYKNVDWLELYDGPTKLGDIQITGNNATITPSSLILTQNVTKALTLKAKTHAVGTYESGTSGENFKVTITGIDAKGVATGSTSVSKSGLDVAATNYHYIWKTMPTVTKVSLSGMANGTQDLYKFTLAADSKGDIGFYKATFAITTSSATVTTFKFYEIDGSSETDISTTALSADEEITNETNNTGGKYAIDVIFDTDSDATGGGELRTIGASSSKTYVLRGDVTGWDSSASIQVQLMGDNVATSTDKATQMDTAANPSNNFIWSDLFLGYTSTTATGANEWTNGYKIFATTTQSF